MSCLKDRGLKNEFVVQGELVSESHQQFPHELLSILAFRPQCSP